MLPYSCSEKPGRTSQKGGRMLVVFTAMACAVAISVIDHKMRGYEAGIQGLKAQLDASNDAAVRSRRAADDDGMTPFRDEPVSRSVQHDFPGQGGALFTRWGREICGKSGDLDTVYTGVAGGSHYTKHGGGSNYLCLPTRNVSWDHYKDAAQTKNYLYGSEFQTHGQDGFFSTVNAEGIAAVADYDVPCAVCRAQIRTSTVMIPARTSCPNDWHMEYQGYLMSAHETHQGRTEFVCVDKNPDVAIGTYESKDGALFYLVEAQCGSLPCGPYIAGREIACVVCTK
ncbi:Hypp2237 [Branchiostoma lanceolatum]|uniref:Hypp2237 protein n=1 Tax=Branchiostoma lanceolatum TaxID=7740 RepID=A0A8K0ERV1_BRALA|nr:Hypp2237 [Branchiostoma lanceolatum]